FSRPQQRIARTTHRPSSTGGGSRTARCQLCPAERTYRAGQDLSHCRQVIAVAAVDRGSDAPDRHTQGDDLPPTVYQRAGAEAARLRHPARQADAGGCRRIVLCRAPGRQRLAEQEDRKSTRLNSSHVKISYAVFCLKKKKKNKR